MHTRISLVLSFLSISFLLAACAPAAPSTDDQSSSSVLSEGSSSSQIIMEPGADGQEDEPEAMQPTDDDEDDDRDAMEGEVNVNLDVSATTPRIITVDARNFTFSPSAISVKKGEKITLRLKSMEGNHGFAVADLGINTPVSEGKTVDVELPTDKTGTFSFRCSVPCGPGHKEMTGVITIAE